MTANEVGFFPRTALADAPHAPFTRAAELGPLLVATDGSAAADAALRAAYLLAARTNADVHVLSVVEPVLVPTVDGLVLPSPEGYEQARKAQRLAAVRAQVRRVAGADCAWEVEVRLAPPARTIAWMAHERGARLIVLGLGRHRVSDRLFGTETALRVVQLADVPVLAVAPDFTALPHRAVLATDFSEISVRAARTALPLLRDPATAYLVNVRLPIDMPDRSWGSAYEDRVSRSFERLRAQLDAPDGVTLETIRLPGDPASTTLDFAATAPADLIVAGSHGYGFFARLVLRSVSTRLLRGARCSVLIVPPRDS
ncbi:MAG TPA: universal stress protein [Gemmatimonadaceae bacterium]|nr:universal stress protein [Gemmatimonadaceae bacterium]